MDMLVKVDRSQAGGVQVTGASETLMRYVPPNELVAENELFNGPMVRAFNSAIVGAYGLAIPGIAVPFTKGVK